MTRKTTISFLAAAVAVGGLSVQPGPVGATENVPCAQRTSIVDTLNSQYKESPRAIGLVSNEAMLEVFVSETGSWTVVVTNPAGVSCVLAAGQSWEEIPLTSTQPGA